MTLASWLVVVGIGMTVAFASTSKHMTVGPVSTFCGLFVVPAAIALIWRGAHFYGWWMIPLFIGISLTVGVLNGRMVRAGQTAALFGMQPLLGVGFVSASVACWLFR